MRTAILLILLASVALPCDLTRYRDTRGLSARGSDDAVELAWDAEAGAELRVRLTAEGRRPTGFAFRR